MDTAPAHLVKFFSLVVHGDAAHRKWLFDAFESYWQIKLPPDMLNPGLVAQVSDNTPFIGESQTLKEAKDWLRARLERGASCPCCTQHAKVYTRALASSLTAALIALHRLTTAHPKTYYHVNEIIKAAGLKHSIGREFSIVRYWGLIEEKAKGDESDKKNSGFWKITEKGVDFVLTKVAVPSHVRLFDSRALGFTGKDVFVSDCLKAKFSYADLMTKHLGDEA